MLENLADFPDILRDKTVTITLQGGREFIGLRMTNRHSMIGMLEFATPSMEAVFIRESHISAIEVWAV